MKAEARDYMAIKGKQVEEKLRCEQCNLGLVNPRLLKCGHSFCHRCIEDYLVLNAVRRQ